MRCLLVEDEPARVAAILPKLEEYFGTGSVQFAGDRDTAMALVEAQAFDLVVLDQKIPSREGQLDPDVIHGRSVHDFLRSVAPDTVVFFLTGLPMEDDYIDELIKQGAQCDVWGDRSPVPVIARYRKDQLDPFFTAVSALAKTARVTADIEVSTGGGNFSLDDTSKRLLRRFARLHSGILVEVEPVNDGLSGAPVVKATVKDKSGNARIAAIGKVDGFAAVARETHRYDSEIVRLPAGSYAPVVAGQVPRVLDKSAAFYRLLDGYDASLFQVLKRSSTAAAASVVAIRSAQKPWYDGSIVRQFTVLDLAKLLIWEDRLPALHAQLGGIDWQPFEERQVSVHFCTRHGDLHGENALINTSNGAMLIDYGAVEPLPSAIDAITLELSPFFHPHGHRELLNWKAEDGEIDWFDRRSFRDMTSVPDYIEATRSWAHEEAFGDREVLACAYVYALRQLQFRSTEKPLALSILAGIVRRGLG